jgi:hypothetical protein
MSGAITAPLGVKGDSLICVNYLSRRRKIAQFRLSPFPSKAPASGDLAPSIVAGLALSLTEASTGETRFERQDRLPVFRAQQELSVRAESAAVEFLRHIFESWIIAQHVYWSVG